MNPKTYQKTQRHIDLNISRFRSTILSSVRSDNQVTVVSYDRRILSQTGIGHFSPIGGYHGPSDKVLILDVARFKYPPHWVNLEILFRAMQCIDAETDIIIANLSLVNLHWSNKPRGYMLMSLNSDVKPLLLLQLFPNSDNIIKLHKDILNLLQNVAETISPDLRDSFKKFLVALIRATPPILEFRDDIDFNGQNFYNRCCSSCECDLKETQVRILTTEFLPQLMSLPEFDRCATSNKDIVTKMDIISTALFYSWPFDLYFPNELAILVGDSRKIALEQISVLLVNEFDQINNQIRLFIVESDIKKSPLMDEEIFTLKEALELAQQRPGSKIFSFECKKSKNLMESAPINDGSSTQKNRNIKVVDYDLVRKYYVININYFCDYYESILKIHPQNLRYHEIIRCDKPCRLYLDLEFEKTSNVGLDGRKLTACFLNYIIGQIEECFQLIRPSFREILALDSSTEEKFSHHVIVHLPGGKLFRNNAVLGRFMKFCVRRLENMSRHQLIALGLQDFFVKKAGDSITKTPFEEKRCSERYSDEVYRRQRSEVEPRRRTHSARSVRGSFKMKSFVTAAHR
uniref:glutathione gamma-glutamylcysteinyltransferase n=1 Tax=Romanomermis culicivorax TaxID=13658 RepID=A0A915KGQ2_ROMCU